ncbi:hypothetical protein L598_000700000180 [Mesorhizobium sp. J18]|nr:hypothetical protein L598_000700000180 [Mesorhizobium sp. J18]
MAAQCRVVPQLAIRAGDAFFVQGLCDVARGDAGREVAEDTAHDLSFLGDNLPVAPDRLAMGVILFDHAIAIGVAATGLSFLDATTKAAPCLVGKVLEEQCVHRALQTDMEFGDFPFGQGDDGDAGELEMLEQGRHVRLIAADAVQRLGQHHIIAARLRLAHELLNAGTENGAGAGDGGIRVAFDDPPAFARRVFLA